MTEKFRIPDMAVKYILYQRTEYIALQKTLLFRALRKLVPSFNYNRMVVAEAMLRKSKIKDMYLDDMEKEYLSIKQYLPEKCTDILDIGCGVAGIDIFLNEHYRNREIDFYLLDKTQIDEGVYYLFEEKGSFYNSLSVAKELLTNKGVHADRVHLLEATENNEIILDGKVDLALSLISWGFHYPVSIYLKKVYELLNNDGRLILDVRKDTTGLELIAEIFGSYKVILEKRKLTRICATK
jgi:SAM-dependent methyltransferase